MDGMWKVIVLPDFICVSSLPERLDLEAEWQVAGRDGSGGGQNLIRVCGSC
jgi:hypothetical protein